MATRGQRNQLGTDGKHALRSDRGPDLDGGWERSTEGSSHRAGASSHQDSLLPFLGDAGKRGQSARPRGSWVPLSATPTGLLSWATPSMPPFPWPSTPVRLVPTISPHPVFFSRPQMQKARGCHFPCGSAWGHTWLDRKACPDCPVLVASVPSFPVACPFKTSELCLDLPHPLICLSSLKTQGCRYFQQTVFLDCLPQAKVPL